MPSVLVTGANRGLGLEYVRQYCAQGWQVIACTRKPDAAELTKLDARSVTIYALDVVDHKAVDDLARQLKSTPIDVVINNAGTTGPKGAPECMAYSGVENMDYEIWRQIMEVNLLGAFKVATAFHDHLADSDIGVLVNMSSDLGSVVQNTKGNLYSYRASKTALNIVTKGFGNDWTDMISVAMAPGWCQTELGGAGAQIAPEDSVREQIKTIARLTPANSGQFIDRFGEVVAW